MKRNLTIVIGIVLILFGGLALSANLILPAMGLTFRWWQVWRMWPIAVIGAGLLLSILPLLGRGRKGLAALFIPGLPTLVTGGILMFASIFDAWWAWTYLWPLEVLSLALGFAFAAIFTRSPGLGVPAILIGLNGVVLQFCAITGWWGIWSFIWVIEPLAVGLSLLLLSLRGRKQGLFMAGMLFCGFAAVAFATSTSLAITGWWPLRFLGPVVLIVVGLAFLFWSFVPRRTLPAETA
jgi:hypothetical protein